MNRYRVAKAMGEENYRQVLKEDTELLAAYGLRLMSVEGGVHAVKEDEVRGQHIHPWNMLSIDNKTWNWLRPILEKQRKLESLQAAAK